MRIGNIDKTHLRNDAHFQFHTEFKGLVEEQTPAALIHFNIEVREAAKRLKIVFDTYGNIAKKSLNEQTSATYNILQELEGQYATDAAKVGLTPWIAELVRNRVDEGSVKVDIVLRKARIQLDEKYHAIVERINALAVVEGVENYEAFIRKLNINIAKYAFLVQVSKRGKKKGGDKQIEGGSL